MLGLLGNILLVILSCLVFGQVIFTLRYILVNKRPWFTIDRALMYGNLIGTLGLFFFVSYLFISDQFVFYQVWKHSNQNFSLLYKLSAVWEGQEGSFLLWLTFQSMVSFFLFYRRNKLLTMAGLCSLVLQLLLLVPLWPGDGKSWVSLFAETIEVLSLPGDSLKTNWILKTGEGMSPLLQNYWMAIHPPIIFLGFSLASIPYGLAIGGLFKPGTQWLIHASVWLTISLTVLTIGIFMGAFWAYETLNFGGYWSWDPVENAIFLPWLIGVGALHMNQVAKGKEQFQRFAIVLNIIFFVTIVYATFLTRSGVLSNISVHAFVESGYRNFLITFLVLVVALPVCCALIRRRYLPASPSRIIIVQRSDWPFLVALLFILGGFQIFVYITLPVLASILRESGVLWNLAPAAPIAYSRWQGCLAIVLMICLLLLEFRVFTHRSRRWLIVGLGSGLVLVAVLSQIDSVDKVLVIILGVLNFGLLVLLSVRIYEKVKSRQQLSSIISHWGFTIMLLGILFSNSLISPDENNQEHTLLTSGLPVTVHRGSFLYKGKYLKDEYGNYLQADWLLRAPRAKKYLAKQVIATPQKVYNPGDILTLDNRDWYFLMEIDNGRKRSFYGHIHFSGPSDYLVTPTIQRSWFYDTYMNISNLQDDMQLEWDSSRIFHQGEPHQSLRWLGNQELKQLPGVLLNDKRKAYSIKMEAKIGGRWEFFSPVVIVEKHKPFVSLPDIRSSLSARMKVINWTDPTHFSLSFSKAAPDWITLRIDHKPLINLFWLGGALIIIGMILSIKNKDADPGRRFLKRVFKKRKINLRRSKVHSYVDV